MKFTWQKLKKDNRGFSLVEMLVAVAIFGAIVTSFGSVFAQMLSLQRRGLSAQKIQENATYVLELMAKEIRVSTLSAQDSDCSEDKSSLTMLHPVNGTITYAWSGSVVQRTVDATTTNITSNDVSVTRLNFCVLGSDIDQQQARVAVIMNIQDPQGKLTFNVQTTIATREYLTEL